MRYQNRISFLIDYDVIIAISRFCLENTVAILFFLGHIPIDQKQQKEQIPFHDNGSKAVQVLLLLEIKKAFNNLFSGSFRHNWNINGDYKNSQGFHSTVRGKLLFSRQCCCSRRGYYGGILYRVVQCSGTWGCSFHHDWK